MADVVLVGGGGHAVIVADAIRATGWRLVGYLDAVIVDRFELVTGVDRLGDLGDLETVLSDLGGAVVGHAAIGDNDLRADVDLRLSSLGRLAPPIVHPSAVVSPWAELGGGCFVGARAVVQPRAVVGEGVIVNTAAIVEHDCVVGEHTHLAPSSTLCGTVAVGCRCLVGVGATVLPNVSVGDRCVVAGGAVAIADVPDGSTVVGVPARPVGALA